MIPQQLISERLIAGLTDPALCPSCGAPLVPGSPSCAACHLPLRGPLATRVWDASLRAGTVLRERAQLIDQLRTTPVAAAAGPTTNPTTTPATATPGSPPATAPGWHPAPPSRPHPPADATPRGVQQVLVGVGALLLALAALYFLVTAWDDMGVAGRGLVLLAVTGAAVAGTYAALRGTLRATAEAIAGLAVALVLLDAYAARRVDLFSLGGTDGVAFWGVVTLAVAALVWAWARSTALVLPELSAAVLATLGTSLVAARIGDGSDLLGALALVAGSGALAASHRRHLWRSSAARSIAAVGSAMLWVAGSLVALAVGADDPSVTTTLAMVGVAAAAAAVALATGRSLPATSRWRQVASAAATLVAFLGAVDALQPHLGWRAAALLGQLVAVVALTVLLKVPHEVRRGPLVAAGIGALLTGGPAIEVAADSVSAALRHDPWASQAGASAPFTVLGTVPTPGLLDLASIVGLGAALALVLCARRAAVTRSDTLTVVEPVAAATGTLLLAAAVLVFELPLLATALLLAAVAAAAACAGAHLRHTAIVGAGAALAALATGWAVASSVTTVATLALLLVGAVAAYVLAVGHVRTGLLGAALGLAYALAWTSLCANGASRPLGAALAVAVLAALTAAGSRWWSGDQRSMGERVAVLGGVLGLAAAAGDATALSGALAAAGAGAGVVALAPDRRRVGWLAAVLLLLATWVAMGDAGASLVEAYTLPAAAVLLAVGHLARRRTPLTSGDSAPVNPVGSWHAYGTGLTLAFVPSLVVALDSGGARAALLGLAALVTLLLGARSRLQAPLVLGTTVLVVDVLLKGLPYAATLPRWAAIAAAGLLLLGLGATYERRLEQVKNARSRLATYS